MKTLSYSALAISIFALIGCGKEEDPTVPINDRLTSISQVNDNGSYDIYYTTQGQIDKIEFQHDNELISTFTTLKGPNPSFEYYSMINNTKDPNGWNYGSESYYTDTLLSIYVTRSGLVGEDMTADTKQYFAYDGGFLSWYRFVLADGEGGTSTRTIEWFEDKVVLTFIEGSSVIINFNKSKQAWWIGTDEAIKSTFQANVGRLNYFMTPYEVTSIKEVNEYGTSVTVYEHSYDADGKIITLSLNGDGYQFNYN